MISPRHSSETTDAFKRVPRLMARLSVMTAIFLTCALYDTAFYRHFAHAKSFALWILVFTAAAGALIGWRRGKILGEGERETRLFRLAVLLVAFSWFASLPVAVNVGHGYEFLIRVVPILVVAWWSAQRPLAWRDDIARFLGAMIMTTAVVFFLGILQFDTFQNQQWFWSIFGRNQGEALNVLHTLHLLSQDRLLATLGNANSAASFFVAALILMLSMVLLDRSTARRIGSLILIAILVYALAMTRSRGGIVAAGAGVGFVLFTFITCGPKRSDIERRVVIGLFAALALVTPLILGAMKMHDMAQVVVDAARAEASEMSSSRAAALIEAAEVKASGKMIACWLLSVVAALLGGAALWFHMVISPARAEKRQTPENRDLLPLLGMASVGLTVLFLLVSVVFTHDLPFKQIAVTGGMLGLLISLWLGYQPRWSGLAKTVALAALGVVVGGGAGALAAMFFGSLLVGGVVGIAVLGCFVVFGQAYEARGVYRKGLSWGVAVFMFVWIVWLLHISRLDTQGLMDHNDNVWGPIWGAISDSDDKDFYDRLYIWNGAATLARENPLVGIGWAQFPLIYPRVTQREYYNLWRPTQLITTEEAHSGHLNLALETGLLGTISWLLLLGLVWRGAMRRMKWANEGDENARMAVIWFPMVMAVLTHMVLDKFWNYPASLTMMAFGFGALVRPRDVVELPAKVKAGLGERSALPWLSAATGLLGIVILWLAYANPNGLGPEALAEESRSARIFGILMLVFAGVSLWPLFLSKREDQPRIGGMLQLGLIALALVALGKMLSGMITFMNDSGNWPNQVRQLSGWAMVTNMGVSLLGLVAAGILIGFGYCLIFSDRDRVHLLSPSGARGLALLVLVLLIALPIMGPGMHLAITSNRMALARTYYEQARQYREIYQAYQENRRQISAQQRTDIQRRLRQTIEDGNTVLAHARHDLPWEIDTWTRSLDFSSQITGGAMTDPMSLYLLNQAIAVAPNYYPVKRNLAAALSDTARQEDVRLQSERSRDLLRLAVELNEQVLTLRPDELMTLHQLGTLYADAGSYEEAVVPWSQFVNYEWYRKRDFRGDIDRWGNQLQDYTRVRLAQALERSGDELAAVEQLHDAGINGVRINQMGTWLQECILLVKIGEYERALAQLAEYAELATDGRVARHRAMFLRNPDGTFHAPRNQSEVAIEIFAALHADDVTAVEALTNFSATASPSDADWAYVALMSSLVDADLAQRRIAEGKESYPDSEILASVEAILSAE